MEVNSIYKCNKCQAVVETIFCPQAEPSCCDETMTAITENTVDAAKEKHVPVIEKIDGGYKVTVGSVPHPMLEEHWITTIELIAGNQVLRQTLKPGEAPEAVFKTDATSVTAREYCNLHGLWSSSN